MRFVLAFLLAMGFLASSPSAQYPVDATALYWSGTSGSAGTFCWGFSCTPSQATVSPGEAGTLMVRGELNQTYILGLSDGASRCLSLPGVSYGLVLDDPIFIVRTGVCGDPGGILACPYGTDTFGVVIPPGAPSGFSVSIQALVSVPSGPGIPRFSFTQGITFSVN